MNISIETDIANIQERLGQLAHKTPSVVSAALNRALTNVASNITKEVRKEYVIKAADVKSTLKKTTANPSSLRGAVTSNGSVIPLDKFKTTKLIKTSRKGGIKSVTKNKGTVKANVKTGGLKAIPSAFVANASGLKIVQRKGKHRLPIARLMGPSVPQMAGNKDVAEYVQKEGQAMFDRRVEHGINRLIQTLGGV